MAVDFEKHESKVVETITVEIVQEITAEVVSALLDAGMSDCFWADSVSAPKGGAIVVDREVFSFTASDLFLSEWLALGGILTFVVEGEKHGLDREAFTDAVQAYCNQRNEPLSWLVDNHDAGDGDAILQMALFGEVVYG